MMPSKKFKFISMLLISSGFLGLSTYASADDLKISNDSRYNLSFSVNNLCSEDFGVVDSHSVKVVSHTNFNQACAYAPTNCVTKVFSKTACTGEQLATVVFDYRYGVQSLTPTGITTKGSGFTLFFEGPWLAK